MSHLYFQLVLGCVCATALLAADESNLLAVVQRYADTMLEQGRDRYGPQASGLFLSVLDRATLAPLTTRPAPPAGIRRGDRSGRPWSPLHGANPQLDANLLRLLYVLTDLTGDTRYARAADENLTWFFNHTQSPTTSLLPWGEHLCWDVMLDQPISGGDEPVHEFARPWLFWDRCFTLVPEPSRRFALGLWEHQIANHQTGAFDRHASYFEHRPVEGKDFPRHAAFYIGTWAKAWQHTRDQTFLQAMETLLARFEKKRVQKDGSLVYTLGPLDLEMAAQWAPEPLAGRLRAFAEKEDELLLAELRAQTGGTPAGAPLPKWQHSYGVTILASQAMLCLARYEQVKKPAYRDLLVAIADQYLGSRPEEDGDAWPMSFGHVISTQLAAHRFTQRPVYLAQATALARLAVRWFWQDRPLPRASLKTGHYEAITGADSLALALLETHAAIHGFTNAIPRNVIDR